MIFPIGDINPNKRFPFVNTTFIILNILAFLMVIVSASAESTFEEVALKPDDPHPFAFLTSMFMHAGIWHLIGNMLYLYICGDNVEDKFGHIGYFFFYLAAGIAADALYLMTVPPEAKSIPLVGASGAISGVLGAYLVFFPFHKIRFLVWIFVFATTFTVPAIIAIGTWAVFQWIYFSKPGAAGESNVAYSAHIGGFIFGVVIAFARRLTAKDD